MCLKIALKILYHWLQKIYAQKTFAWKKGKLCLTSAWILALDVYTNPVCELSALEKAQFASSMADNSQLNHAKYIN
jgi:hypothetical protein